MNRSPGFTLIELMVAIAIGAAVLSSVYLVSRGSSRTFHEQQRIAVTQLDLRLAVEALRADLQRAGLLATPNSSVDPEVCPKPPVPLHAVRLIDGEGAGRVHLPASNRFLSPDRIVLMGDYVDGDVYYAESIDGNTIILDVTTESFRKLARDPARFSAAFSPDHLLRVVDPSRPRGVQFVSIAGSSFASATIRTANPVATVTGGVDCGIAGLGAGVRLNVVTFVDYRVDEISAMAPAAYPDRPGTSAALGRTDLVRRRLRPDGTPIPGTDRIVASYAVDLDFGFVTDDQPSPAPAEAMPVERTGAEAVAVADGTAAARPHAIRSVLLRLSIRTRDEDPSFDLVERTSPAQPLVGYRVQPLGHWAAHVRTLTTEVSLPDLALRGLR